MSRNHRRVNYNNGNYNVLPNNVITMPLQLWTNRSFWQNENEPEHFITINGRRYPNTTTLRELGLGLTQNSVYSDPGEYNVVSPLELPPPAIVAEPHNRIQRSLALPKKRKTARKTRGRSRATTQTRNNNRFGFKKAFGALKKGIKKLTGRSRKNRRS